ncbi:LysR family transcriptional regulator [Duganella qianjiadongensis]|uniref:LysR family transcriptional regulator n=1 Tax=Duganella qianjiadongensis TaxID=2692176 RepID=A0ABW9VGT1_9BURK|nr:LysR family transcriptional regulator [Duganella qianjiadongensis]MYM38221.1 LysR family transcriptional regulator [Duganella qianjiadongensis]
MLRLDDLTVFVRTADSGSLSAAARQLSISPALASAALKRLESVLGWRLFARTTRSLRLTEEGENYLRHAREALRLLQEGQEALQQGQETPGGLLKIAMPSDLGRNYLMHWLDEFQTRYPRVSFQLSVSDRVSDLYRQPVDLAIRYGRLDDSSLVALPLAPGNRRVLVAAPAYLERYGALTSPQALLQHNCLRFMVEEVIHDRWQFHVGGELQQWHVQGNRSADDADVVRRWAVAGLGIAYKSRLDLADDIRTGRLRVLLPDILGEAAPLNMLCMHRQHITPTVLQLRDFLRERCSQA